MLPSVTQFRGMFGATASLCTEWWRATSRFEVVSTYLEWRNLQGLTRLMFAGSALVLGAVPVVMLASPDGPRGDVGAVVALATLIVTIGLAACWLRGWPSERGSQVFVLVADLAIGMTSVVDNNPLAGLNGTQAFVLMGFYVALFHSARIMVGHLSWTIAVSTTIASVLAFGPNHDLVGAGAKLLLTLVVAVTVPLCAQLVVPMFANDALSAARDPLTGLLNRRGLDMATHTRFNRRRSPSGLAVFVIDVDDFKWINDTFGHSIGDGVLRDIGLSVLESVPSAEVARIGGEEFAVAGAATEVDVERLGKLLRDKAAVTVGPRRVTVSVGAAWLPDVRSGSDATAALPRLLVDADQAMYRAKAAGGDRVVVTPLERGRSNG